MIELQEELAPGMAKIKIEVGESGHRQSFMGTWLTFTELGREVVRVAKTAGDRLAVYTVGSDGVGNLEVFDDFDDFVASEPESEVIHDVADALDEDYEEELDI